MSKRTHFTTVTSLPAGISRETVLETLHSHTEMIDLNPLVIERHPIRAPPEATPEEAHCQWYSISDKINYVPGVYTGSVTFHGCFHDLPDGLQTHIYAPMGLNMKGRWTLGGSLPGEPRQPVEIGLGVPKTGLWLREDVDMKCNVVMTGFVKKTTKKAHQTLVDRLVEKAHLKEAEGYNNGLKEQLELRSQYPPDYHTEIVSPATTPYIDSKSTMGHTPSISDAGSIRSGAGSVLDARHSSYGHAQVPVDHKYQSYRPAPAYGGHMQRPGPASHASYPPPLNPPIPNPTPMHFTAELPSQEAKTPIQLELPGQESNTPIELDSSHHRFS
ncbi:MAG: hypothetical protein Q9217_006227 [Psora testacea]